MLCTLSKPPNLSEIFPSIKSPNTLQTPRRALSKTSELKDRVVWLQSAARLLLTRSWTTILLHGSFSDVFDVFWSTKRT